MDLIINRLTSHYEWDLTLKFDVNTLVIHSPSSWDSWKFFTFLLFFGSNVYIFDSNVYIFAYIFGSNVYMFGSYVYIFGSCVYIFEDFEDIEDCEDFEDL